MTQSNTETSPVTQQIGVLNLRINDLMTQLNVVVKVLMAEIADLKKQNAELKEQTSKS